MRGYYAIVDIPQSAPPGLAELEMHAKELLAAGPCCLQVRAKKLSALALRDVTAALLPVCQAAGVPLCVNDRLDVALVVGAPVVHLGQEDLPLLEARRLLARVGRSMVVGVSTHSREEALRAQSEGADYIGFGPVFATANKEKPGAVVGLEQLGRVCAEAKIPVVAIGGITRENLAVVCRAGAAAAAVIGDVENAPDRPAAARVIAEAFGDA